LLDCLDWIGLPNRGTCIDTCLMSDVTRSFWIHNEADQVIMVSRLCIDHCAKLTKTHLNFCLFAY